MKFNCTKCGKEGDKNKSDIFETNFCDMDCYAAYISRDSKTLHCHTCGKPVKRKGSDIRKSKSGKFYCNRSCSATHNNKGVGRVGKNHSNYKHGNSTYRKKALAHYGSNCSSLECELVSSGITIDTQMLDVHHIDGNRKNSDIKNLRVLCVWCHAKITRGM